MLASEGAVAIFEWITDKRSTLPGELHDQIFRFAERHRVVGLALQRAKSPGSVVAKEITSRLQARHDEIVRQQRVFLDLSRDIFEAGQASKTRLLMVKGLAAAAIVGNRHLYRASSDVDMLADHPHAISEIMVPRGYQRGTLEDKHETVLTGDKGTCDIHSYWPLRRRPKDLKDFTQVSVPATEKIDFPELVKRSRTSGLDEMRGMTFPSIEIAALISLTTSQRDVVWEPFSNPSTQLCHFTDAFHLLSMPEVDWPAFDKLVAKYGLEDSVATAWDMYSRFFPANPLIKSKQKFEQDSGVLVQFVNGPSGLWHKASVIDIFFRSFDERLKRLGTTELVNGKTLQHRSVGDTSFKASYEAATSSYRPLRSVRLTAGAESSVLVLHVDKAPEAGDSVFIETGDESSHWYYQGLTWGKLRAQIETSDHDYSVSVTLPKDYRDRTLLIGFECVKGADKVVTALPVLV